MSLEFNVDRRIAAITLRRPEHGNALTAAMVDTLLGTLRTATTEADLLVLRGEGPDFCCGRDRSEAPSGRAPFDNFRPIAEINQLLAEFPGVVIAGVQGRAMGFGLGLVARSDIAIATRNATFMLDEIAHGIAPMFILSGLLDHLAPKHAADLVFSGRAIAADAALTYGLVSRVVEADALDASIAALRDDLSARDPHILRASKAYFAAIGEIPRTARPAYALKAQIDSLVR